MLGLENQLAFSIIFSVAIAVALMVSGIFIFQRKQF